MIDRARARRAAGEGRTFELVLPVYTIHSRQQSVDSMVCGHGGGTLVQSALLLLLPIHGVVSLNNGLALKPPMGYNVTLHYTTLLIPSLLGTDGPRDRLVASAPTQRLVFG